CVDWPKQKIYSILKSLPYPSIITSGDFLDNEDLQMECLYINITKLFDRSRSYSLKLMRKSLLLNDLAYITYTSGSTGPPKGVCTELLGLNNLAANYTKSLAMNRWNSVYQVVNHSFDIFFADLLEAFMNGATLVLANEKIPNAKEMMDITHAYIMPAYLSTLDENAMKMLQKLNAINFGGDHIEAAFLSRGITSGLNLYQQYGLTEVSVYSTLHKIKSLDSKNCIGKSLNNVNFTIRVSNDYCALGRRGICYISGIGLSRGYINDEKLTASKYMANHRLLKEETILSYDRRYFITGDLTEMNQNGQLKFYGRADNQIKIRGHIVDVADVEAILCTLPMIESCVITTQTLKQSFVLIAHIIVRKKFQTLANSQIRNSIIEILTQKIPSFMIPSYFYFIDKFPLNSNGKIDREQLQKIDHHSIQRSAMIHDQYPPILNELETNICRIFSDILEISSI
uniref:AMP-binding domain-containing protein n=1 Tax=Ascaris lumbricoides TaxID=6252 RepID=A0A0M3HKA6_ASCLU